MKFKQLILAGLMGVVSASDIRAQSAEGSELQPPEGVKVLFSPGDDIEIMVVALINGASTQIIFNQHAITNPRIALALVNAFKVRKVFVGGIMERMPPIKNYQSPQYLASMGLPIYYAALRPGGVNNHRYLIIDGKLVMTGSYDWTMAAQTKNSESVIIVNEPTIASAYLKHFAAELKTATPLFKLPKPDAISTKP